jgi:hypothetical protein
MQMASPILEPKTRNKVKFVYPDNPETDKIMEDLFNMDELECAFGGRSQASFNINDFAARMREDDNKMPLFWSPENSALASEPYLMKNHGSQQCSSGLKTEEIALDKIEETENLSEKSEESESTSEEKEETEVASEERGQTEILSEKRHETETGSVKDETETRSEKKEETESSTVKLITSKGEGITSSEKGTSSSDP